MQELRRDWIGDDNQKQPIKPSEDCCCFTCLKTVASNPINFHPARLQLDENQWQEENRKAYCFSQDLKQEYGIELIDSDSEDEPDSVEPEDDESDDDDDDDENNEYFNFKTGKIMQTDPEAKRKAQAAAAAKIMEEVRKASEGDPNREQKEKEWNENRTRKQLHILSSNI